jgi:hypothetical protein
LFEVFGGNDSDNLDGKMVTYVNDTAGKDVVLLSEVIFESLDVGSKVFNGGGRGGFGVGDHGVHREQSSVERGESSEARLVG